MNTRAIKEYIRGIFPNIPFLKKHITRKRLAKFDVHLLSEADVIRGENDAEAKRTIVADCLARWPQYIAKTLASADNVLERAPEYKDRTDKDALRTDMLFCRFAYGFQPDEYLCFELENRTMEQRREFISDIDRLRFIYLMNDIFRMPVFDNKAKTYQTFAPYFKREAVAIQKPADFAGFESFVSRHPVFVKKAVYESCGRSVERIDMSTCGRTARELFDQWTALGLHIIEECVVQSEATAAFNASSVNTIRCITMNTQDGIVIPFTFMKIGRAGSFVDNGGAGGILVGIDPKTGVLDTHGYDELNICYPSHPDSDIEFIGYPLPQWEQMLSICREMSAKEPSMKCIGWDMAHTDNGWVVIEGNGKSQMIGPQIVYRRGTKKETEAIMHNMKLTV